MGVGPVLPIIDQPADSDLTAIAALATTTYGRSLLTTADVDALATAIATRTALSSRYAPFAHTRGNRTIILGDSIAAGADDQTNKAWGSSWFTRLCAASGQRMQFVRNAGVAGNTSTQMLARIATDVVAYAPRWCVLAAVTPNDVSNSIALATRKSNITSMVDGLKSAGIGVVLVTSPPNDTTATRDSLLAMNAWLAGYAEANGVPLWDIYTPLVDTSDSTYASSYTADGIHPNATGQEAIVAALLPRVAETFPRPASFLLAPGKADASNLITNGCFVGDANADGVADNWTKVGSGITAQSLIAMTSDEGVGNWQSVTCNGTLGYVEQTISSGWSVGDVVEYTGRWETDMASGATVQLRFTNGTPAFETYACATAATAGRVWCIRETVPTGTTAIVVRLVVNTSAGDLRIGQVTLRNLTALGVV